MSHVEVGHGHGHDRVGADADRRWLGGRAGADRWRSWPARSSSACVVNSLALLSDAAHMLTDAAALAAGPGRDPAGRAAAQGGYTYGLKRAEILSAQANGITLLLLAAWLATRRSGGCSIPAGVRGLPVLITALVGIVVNLAAAWLIRRADRRSLNVEGAYQHILTDLAAFIATAVAGLVILLHRLHPGRRDRVADRGRADGAGRPRAGPRQRPDPAGGRPGRARPGAGSGRHGGARRAWWRCTTCTSGRSPRARRRCRRTCWSPPAPTATAALRPGGAAARAATSSTHTTLQVDHAQPYAAPDRHPEWALWRWPAR